MQQNKTELSALIDRIHDLEAQSAFQEDSVNQLNAVIIEQQQQMDHLNLLIEALRGAIQSVSSTTATGGSNNDDKPPHY